MRIAPSIAATAIAAALLAAPAAQAELDQQGNLRATFSGSISPQRLPRTTTTAVGVQMGGKIKTTDKATPPKLERIVLEINRHGHLQNKGLGTCSLARLKTISTQAARRLCADALIGRGSVTSRVSLPGQGAFASNGTLLAFNGRHKGKTAVFAQVVSGAPLPLTYVIVFEVKKQKGTFATSLIGTLPPIASEYGYISAFNLNLRRTYRYKGRKMSYASAGCPAPPGFPSANFPLAKASYEFQDGRVLEATLERQCKVRGR